MMISEWIENLEAELNRLAKIDLGYPLGNNAIHPPLPDARISDLLEQLSINQCTILAQFFYHCDGFSLPDVRNGLFVHGLELIARGYFSAEPIHVGEDQAFEVLVIGSTGGGQRLAVNRKTNELIILRPGMVEGRALFGEYLVISLNFQELLERVLADVRAFIENDFSHSFID